MAPSPKRRRTVPVEIPLQTQCTTRFMQAELKWIIRNFGAMCKSKENGEYLTSADFHAAGDEQMKSYLELYPNGDDETSSGKCCQLFVYQVLPLESERLITITFTLTEENTNMELYSERFDQRRFPVKSKGGWGTNAILHNKKLLQVKNLVLHCKLEYEIEKIEPAVNKYSDLATDIARSFTSMDHRDVTFVVDGKEFPAHKLILSARSPVFAAMLKNDTKEAALNRFTLVDIKPDVFEALLRFIYTDQMDFTFEMSKNLLAVSKRYQLDLLEWKCQVCLSQNLSIKNCCEVLMLADNNCAADLKKDAVDFIRKNSVEVVNSDEWKEMKISRPGLIVEIVDKLLVPE